MPLSLRRGRVTAVRERAPGLARVHVDGVPCVAYVGVTGPVEEGDEVLVNVQARELGLGSGGFDVLYANLTRGLELRPEDGSHVMALPYAPGQWACRRVEEDGAMLADRLDGTPVVCCTVHSQVAPVWAGVGDGLRCAYVQVAGGALPVPLSDTLRRLCDSYGRFTTVAVDPCFAADFQAVSVASALLYSARDADVIVCSVGPGIVGTGTRWGHGATALAEVANVASALGGTPILAPRVSVRDERQRHRGVSQHTRSVLDLCLGDVTVAWPRGLEPPDWLTVRAEVDAAGWREACAGLPLSFMRRGPDEEPWFFAAAYAAGLLAQRGAR